MDARTVIMHFVESMTQLMALMRQEIDLVRAKQYDQVERIQRHKTKLTRTFETHQSAIQQNLSMIEVLDETERSELRQLYQAFRDTLSENMLALKAAQDTTQRVVDMIVAGVRKSRGMSPEPVTPKKGPPPRGYGAYAAAGAMGRNLMSRTL
jgi:hypothetical protein